jgi:hypothetical protein
MCLAACAWLTPVHNAHAALPDYTQLQRSGDDRRQDLFTEDAWLGMSKLQDYYDFVATVREAEQAVDCGTKCAGNR